MSDHEFHVLERESTCPHCGHTFPAMFGEAHEPGATGKLPVAICTRCFNYSVIEAEGLVVPPDDLINVLDMVLGPHVAELRAAFGALNQEEDASTEAEGEHDEP